MSDICPSCGKELYGYARVVCPYCKQVNQEAANVFASEQVADETFVCYLWELDGSHASSIWIRKEIVFGGKIVFHLYNHIDPSYAHSGDSGGRVNPLNEPFEVLDEVLALAIKMRDEALASGKWFYAEDLPQK